MRSAGFHRALAGCWGGRGRVKLRRAATVIGLTITLVAGLMAPLVVAVPRAAADTLTWNLVNETAPPPALRAPSMAFDAATDQMVLVGSNEAGGDDAEETWVLDGNSTTWQEVDTIEPAPGEIEPDPANSPPTRANASLAYYPGAATLYLFGGLGSGPLGDFWSWDGTKWTDLTSDYCDALCPSARYGAPMAFDPNSGDLLLYGGTNGSGALADTWLFNPESGWSNVSATADAAVTPLARYGAAIGYDSENGVDAVVMYSGFDAVDDMYTWTGTEWEFANKSTDSGAVGGAAYADDTATGQFVLFGGEQLGPNAARNLTTVYTGSLFVPQTPANSPSPREFVAMAYDPDLSQIVLFGGDDGSGDVYNDTWTYGPPLPTVTATLSDEPTTGSVEHVAISALPATTVAATGEGAGATAAAALSAIPLSAIDLSASPLSAIPLSAIPLSAIAVPSSGKPPAGITAAQRTLDSTLLSDLSIAFPAGCGVASGAACTGWAGVLAGSSYANVPLEGITLADVLADPVASVNLDNADLGGLDLASSPLSAIPLSAIELGSAPLSAIGLGGAADGSAALTAWCSQLTQAVCNNFGISPGATSTSVTVLTLALAGVPLSAIPLSAIPLSAIPLSAIPLSAINVASNPLSAIPLSAIPLSAIDLSTSPLSAIPLSAIPLSAIPLSAINLGEVPLSAVNLAGTPLSSTPLSAIPLSAIPLSAIDVAATPLSAIPLSAIPLSAIGEILACADASSFCGLGATATLGQAVAAGDVASGATLGELGAYGGATLSQLGASGSTTVGELPASALADTTLGQLLTGDDTTVPAYPSLTLGDLILSTVPPSSYQWGTVDLSDLPLAAALADGTEGAATGGGGTDTYTAGLTVENGATPVQVTVDLPPGFAYAPESSSVDNTSVADPTGSSTLTWDLPSLAQGSHTLTFTTFAGTGLGPATATLSASVGGTVVSSASASTDVVDLDQPDINSPNNEIYLGPSTTGGSAPSEGDLDLGYITAPGDLDDWHVTVAQGAELSLALTDLPATYDLELFGPATPQLQGTPSQDLPGVSDTLPSLQPGSTTEGTPGSQDLPVTPPAGYQLEAVSNNPDGQSQYIQTTPLAAGTYIVQVSGYNGAYSSQPYLLRSNLSATTTEESCPSGISYLGALAGVPAASGPVSIPHGVNTLFLVDTQRLTAAFGTGPASQIEAQLQQVAADTAAGVSGAVIPVDAYATVQAAYAAWNANPCSVDAANGVVAAISSVVDTIRANNPTVQNLVVIGADDQIPFARVPDGATQSNERDYGDSTFAGENNVEGDALSLGYDFSDDPYGANTPLGVGSATLYDPQVAVGRLVESAPEIEGALSRFVSTNGVLNATTGLTTGYSFLTSGADAVSANLAADGLSPSNLINESWTTSDLDTALATGSPGVASINAHFDYSRALPAYDNANNTETDLFTTTDVRNATTSFAGRLLFSMGCHAGLDIDDAEVGSSTPVDDWAKTFADTGALWVANTGYGYADTDTVAYSAKLMAEFAGNLNGTLSIGEALTVAKQQYAAGNAIPGPYDLKALMESTLYGLPMYHLNTASPPVAPPSGPALSVDPATGLTAAPVALSLSGGTGAGQYTLVNSPNGSYYEVNGAGATPPGTQATEYRPIEPLVTVGVTEPGYVPHGALVTGLTSSDTAGFTPAYSLPAAGAADSTPPTIGDAAFPGALQRVAAYSTFTATGTAQAAQLDLVTGQFIPNPTAPGTGVQRLFSGLQAKVFYQSPGSALANDYTPATIDATQEAPAAGALDFSVQVTPSSSSDPVGEVIVLYTDASHPGTWSSVSLSSTDGLNWSASAPTSITGAQYIVEAVDAAGNVAVSDNEGADFNASAEAPITVTLSGATVTNGYYTGPVTAEIAAPAGSVYVLDGAAPQDVPTSGVVIASAGTHILTVSDPAGDRATESFAISTSQTTAVVSSNADPSSVGQPVTFSATVAPATPSAGTPSGNVEFLDGTTPIAACGGTAGEALTGGRATCGPVTYGSTGSHQVTADYLGSSSFAAAISVAVAQVVQQAHTTATVSSSANPSAVGQPVTYTAAVAVTGAGAGTPTGAVEFLDGNTALSACGGASGTPLAANGTAICMVTFATGGVHQITATYLGDANFSPSAPSAPLPQRVTAPTTTTLSSSDTAKAVVGEPIVYTARVAAPNASGTPSGNVEFLDGGVPIVTCGGATGEALNGAGTASCTVAYAAPGSHQVTAVYLGQGSFTGSVTSSALSEVIHQASSTTTLTSSADPSVVGVAVVYTAKVAALAPGAGSPTGDVEFLDGGTAVAACGGATGEAVVGLGAATCTVTYTTTGTHQITATYLGDSNFVASTTAAALAQTVNKASTTVAVSSGANPIRAGSALTLTAKVSVTAANALNPTGYVEFFDGSSPLAACGATKGEALNASDVATCVVAFTAIGVNNITATYLGNVNFGGSTTGTPLAETVTASTFTFVSSSANPSQVGKSVTFTATVGLVAPATGTPSGSVEWLAGGTPITNCGGSTGETINSGGKATCTETYTKAGVQNLVATYLGTVVVAASSSAIESEVVTSSVCKTLAGCNLSGLNLAGANLAGANLCSANLSGADLAGADLFAANLCGANLYEANLAGADLFVANLAGTDLAGANLPGADLAGADLVGANLRGVNAPNAYFNAADLAGDTATNSDFMQTNFTAADLAGANLSGSNITGANFTLANLKGAKL